MAGVTALHLPPDAAAPFSEGYTNAALNRRLSKYNQHRDDKSIPRGMLSIALSSTLRQIGRLYYVVPSYCTLEPSPTRRGVRGADCLLEYSAVLASFLRAG